MEKLSKFCIIVFFSLLAFPEGSRADVHSALWWVSTLSKPLPTDNTGGFGILGFGATVEYLPISFLGIETGLMLQPTFLNGNLSENVVIPLLIRLWLTDKYTFAGGLFYSEQMTNLPENLSGTNYGLRLMAGLNWPYGKDRASALAVEAGYQYTNLNRSLVIGGEYYENQMVFQVGFRFGSSSSKHKIRSNGVLPSLPYVLATPPSMN